MPRAAKAHLRPGGASQPGSNPARVTGTRTVHPSDFDAPTRARYASSSDEEGYSKSLSDQGTEESDSDAAPPEGATAKDLLKVPHLPLLSSFVHPLITLCILTTTFDPS